MQEYSSVTASAYDAESLTPLLTKKADDGWSVVSIVSTGSKVVAYLMRNIDGVHEIASAQAADEAIDAVAVVDAPTREAGEGDGTGVSSETEREEEIVVDATVLEPVRPAADEATPYTVESPSESSAPAGWYADPSSRFELRYWDGNEWTEHVSRAGQQYTDPVG